MTSQYCKQLLNEPTLSKNKVEKNLCSKNFDSSDYLNEISLEDFSDYCLAFTFTSRNFSNGTIGVAWIAKEWEEGGICQPFKYVNGIKQSLNTGVVTVKNFNYRIPEPISKLAFVHEVGHSFGSEHDPISEPICSPDFAHGGSFLMSRSAATGREINNKYFSKCSKTQMGLILHALVKDSDNFCFKSIFFMITS